jgi:D-alanyl-D-alanine carboxypeptidase
MCLNSNFYRILAIFLCFTISGYTAEKSKINYKGCNYKKIKKNVEAIVSNAQVKFNAKAIMFALTIGGEEVVNNAYGISMTEANANRHMHFRIGAPTIAFEASLMLQLVDRKMLNLDDKISKWYPDLPFADIITIRMLANSTTGYYDYVHSPIVQNADVFMEWSPDELVAIAVAQPMAFFPGTSWQYSHTNFVILGQILEKVSGMPMNHAITEYILNPLNLQNTHYPTNSKIQKPVLHAYTSARGVYEDSTYWNPSVYPFSGIMISNLSDMGKWARAFGTGQLISKKSYGNFIAPTTVGLGPLNSNFYFGLGALFDYTWIILTVNVQGYTAIFAYLPSTDLAMVVYNTVNEGTPPNINLSLSVFYEVAAYLNTIQPIPTPIFPPSAPSFF